MPIMAQERLMPSRRDVLAGAAVLALAAPPALAQTTATARGSVRCRQCRARASPA